MGKHNSILVKMLHNEVWSQGNIDILGEICSDDFTVYYPNEIWRGIEKVKENIIRFRKSFPDWKENIDETIVAEDKVVKRFTSTGTHLGILFNGIPPTGKSVLINEIAIYTIKDCKIVEQRSVFDMYALYKQLGIL